MERVRAALIRKYFDQARGFLWLIKEQMMRRDQDVQRYKDWRSRLSFLRQEYGKTLCARMARILPAFGMGGVVNSRLRYTV